MKSSNRLVLLYQYLVEHNDWMTAQQLAAVLSCSVSTIRKELKTLKSFLPDTWFLESQRGKGIRLNRPSNQPILPFTHVVSDTDILQNLIRYLIHNESGGTLTELSRKLFYSVSAISKMMRILKQELKKYHLKLDTKPVKISGDEFHLRQFYFDYYLHTNCTASIQQETLTSIRTLMKSIEQTGGFKFSDISYIQLPIVFSVWQGRLCKKKFITNCPSVFYELGEPLRWMIPIIERHLKILHIRASSHELHYGAALLLGVPRSEGKIVEVLEPCYIDSVCKVIQYMEEKTRFPFSEDNILLQQVYDYSKHARVRWITGIHSYANQHAIKIKKCEFTLFTLIHEAMHQYFHYTDSIRDDDVADITMFFVASKQGYRMQQKEKTILLYVNEIGVMRYVKLKLLENICGLVKIMTAHHVHEMEHLASKNNIDVIVTTNQQNYTLLTNGIPVIHIGPIPTSYDFNIIKDTLKM
ncbi:helix-turn-helix domain-containing protein [Paenibacillus thiaminolyticus]|uniref:BglG family transcription antiterminator n=1 Tax=Paenibacillus thiaminolyticus TaxID=49283 RepID=UPI003D27704A